MTTNEQVLLCVLLIIAVVDVIQHFKIMGWSKKNEWARLDAEIEQEYNERKYNTLYYKWKNLDELVPVSIISAKESRRLLELAEESLSAQRKLLKKYEKAYHAQLKRSYKEAYYRQYKPSERQVAADILSKLVEYRSYPEAPKDFIRRKLKDLSVYNATKNTNT